MDVLGHTEQQLLKYNLLEKGTRIVTAVSGGPDSMALFHVLHFICLKWDVELVAAHLNHGFRPAESKAEAELVQRMADQLGRRLEYAAVDMPSYIAETKQNSQSAARKKRYAFFRKVCRNVNAKAIVLAHHADDQAETIFMRILKGASVKSLAGIAEVRMDSEGICIVRPLLDIPKQALLEYCRDHAIEYAVDSSNESTTYFRNQVRLEIFPYLQKFQPQLTQALNRLGKIAAMENEWIDEWADKFIQEHVILTNEKQVRFHRQPFLKLHPALQKRVIPLILKYVVPHEEPTYDYQTIETICAAIQNDSRPSVQLHLPLGIHFVREYDQLYVQKGGQTIESFHYEISQFPVELELGSFTVSIYKNKATSEHLYAQASAFECVLDADRLKLPLTIRSRLPGDRMRISGMKGTKKVKDIFIDDKVPPSKREQIPIFVDGAGEIIWIAGIRYSGLYEPHDASQSLLHIVCRPNIN